MKKIIIALTLIYSTCFAGLSEYNTTPRDKAVRLAIEPAVLAAHLEETDSPVVTAYTVADVATNLSGAVTLVADDLRDFSFDAGNERYYFSRSGAVDIPFSLNASISFSQSAASAVVIVRATKNGVAVEGIYFKRSITNSGDVGAAPLNGHFTLSDGDYLQISVESSKIGSFNVWSFVTDIHEEAE